MDKSREPSLTFVLVNNRLDSTVNQRNQELADRVTWLFRDSFRLTEQIKTSDSASRGEQQKWRLALRDAHGKVVHSPGLLLLNPLPQSSVITAAKSVVQLVLPALSRPRLLPTYPMVDLQHEPVTNHTEQVSQLVGQYIRQNQRSGQVREVMAHYRLLHATVDPAQPQLFRRGLSTLIALLPVTDKQKSGDLLASILHLNPLYRATYHPDVVAVGRQQINQADIPVNYKGVVLQPKQIRNLLLGNTIEVAGIRDPKRGGLYRAGVSFNILHGRLDETSRQEQLRTDNRQEALLHKREVNRQDADNLRHSPQFGGITNKSSTPEVVSRPVRLQ